MRRRRCLPSLNMTYAIIAIKCSDCIRRIRREGGGEEGERRMDNRRVSRSRE